MLDDFQIGRLGQSPENTPSPDSNPDLSLVQVELLRLYGLEEMECGWNGLIDVISRRLCLERLHLSLDAGRYSEMLAVEAPYYYSEDQKCWLTLAYKRIFFPIVRELRGRLEDFHIFLCWGIEAQAEEIMERIVLGDAQRPISNGKIDYYERDTRSPHWKVLEEEGENNKRALTQLEHLKMFEMDEENIMRWLQQA